MSNAEEPKAGQWWLHSNGNVMFIAFDERTIGGTETIPILAYAEDLEKSWHRPGEFVRRLPDDAGFDWKPASFDPKTFTSDWGPFEKIHSLVPIESPSNQQLFEMIANLRDQMDRMAAKIDFLKSPHLEPNQTAEPDPEEWVTQDRVPARRAIDQWRVVCKDGSASEWCKRSCGTISHGFIDHFKSMAEVRCRRKDLPPLPESKPNRIPVRLYWYDGNVVARYGHSPPTDPSFIEIKLDPQMIISCYGFYVEGTGT